MAEQARKVPSQIYKWFERMKESYDQSIQNTLKKFELYSHQQQERIDSSHKDQIEQLKAMNERQSILYNKQIEQLHKDVIYYREQLDKKQQTIDDLNTRYDSVIRCILPSKQSNNIKDIFSEHDFLTPITHSVTNDVEVEDINESEIILDNPQKNLDSTSIEEKQVDPELLFEQAILQRNNNENSEAFSLFQQAALLGHARSMGAMGRAFFLGEGVTEDQCIGLAWLINAANLKLPQAIERVEHFVKADPELYSQAKIQAGKLI